MNDIAMMVAIAKRFGSGGGGSSSVQPDWNQNDPAAPDYVKNRTHYDNKHVVGLDITKDYPDADRLRFRNENGQNPVGVGDEWIKISDLAPSCAELMSTGKRKGSNNDEVFAMREEGTFDVQIDTEDYYSVGPLQVRSPYGYLFVVLKAGATLNLGPELNTQGGYNTNAPYTAIAPSAGIYACLNTSASGSSTLFERLEWGNIVPLDPKYLPENVGTVKSVNGVLPDERGNLSLLTPPVVTFYYVPAVNNLSSYYTIQQIKEFMNHGHTEFALVIYDMSKPSIKPVYYSAKMEEEVIQGQNAEYYKHVYHLHFDDNEVAPILVDFLNDTITLDPDWVAPEPMITEADANELVNTKIAELAAQEVTLPMSNGTPNHGTAGQFAVSDGKGGIVWKTLVEAEEVSY